MGYFVEWDIEERQGSHSKSYIYIYNGFVEVVL